MTPRDPSGFGRLSPATLHRSQAGTSGTCWALACHFKRAAFVPTVQPGRPAAEGLWYSTERAVAGRGDVESDLRRTARLKTRQRVPAGISAQWLGKSLLAWNASWFQMLGLLQQAQAPQKKNITGPHQRGNLHGAAVQGL